jgi:quercetin dioxygenase-like cupin family protein
MEKEVKGFVKSYRDVKEMPMDGGAKIRWAITHREGAENFSMRIISIDRNKETPAHSHDYEHEMYIISGNGEATIGKEIHSISTGDFVFIPPNIFHKIHASEDMKLICVVPIKAAKEILGE